MDVNGCKWMEWLELIGNGWIWLEMAEHFLKWLEIVFTARNGWKWLEMAGNG